MSYFYGLFKCCHYCKPPKRYPGCSGKCPDYADDYAKMQEMKRKQKPEKETRDYVIRRVSQFKPEEF